MRRKFNDMLSQSHNMRCSIADVDVPVTSGSAGSSGAGNASSARARRVFESYHIGADGMMRRCGVSLPPTVLFASYLPPPGVGLLLHIPAPQDALMTTLLTGARVGTDAGSVSLAHYSGILQMMGVPDASLPAVRLSLQAPVAFANFSAPLRALSVGISGSFRAWMRSIAAFAPSSLVSVAATMVEGFVAAISQCTSFCVKLLWPDRFRVSYAYLPWHLPFDLAIALIIIILGLDAAKAFALIVQVRNLDLR
jgi:hypothetical protein